MCSGGGVSTPKVPEPTPVPETPTASTAVQARKNEESSAKRARGAKSTVLTSGLGLGTEASTKKPTLLGQ